MKYGLLSFRASVVAICSLWLTLGTITAQEQQHLSGPYTGGQIEQDAIFSVQDPELANITNYVDEDPATFIKLEVLDNTGPYFKFNYELKLNITPITASGNGTSYIKSLRIAYDPYSDGGTFRDQAFHVLENAHGAQIEVVGVELVNEDNVGPPTGSPTPGNIALTLGFKTKRYYEYTATVPTPQINADVLEATITWPQSNPDEGITHYELEWSWVDSYGTTGTTDILWNDRDFELNSTRVETKNTAYTIPLIYGDGYLIYRVRGVGRFMQDTSRYYYGDWSSGTNTKNNVADWPDMFETSGHEDDVKNWQFQASYAEEGKKKEVVSYFDGTLRNRQTVTRINSDYNAIVGEVIYDAQGRPAIEVLPVPTTGDNRLKFYRGEGQNGFNQNSSGQVYSSYDFDWETISEGGDPTCATEADGMVDTSGASHYYGPQAAAGTYQDYVPDAQNFPFSQIEYTNDNTGRINRKSGVGPDHQLGTDHEMKYFYTIPTQEELNRLFGYRVGNATHYKKNVVIDPNGQVSISYIDPQGRTIATALAADNPEKLLGLDDEENAALHNLLTADLLNKVNPDDTDTDQDNNNSYTSGNYGVLEDGLKYEAQKVLTTDGAQYTFDYSASGPEAFAYGCMEPGQGYPFVYKLLINVTDACGDPIADGGAIERNIGTIPGFLPPATDDEGELLPPLLGLNSTSGTFSETAQIQEILTTGSYNVIKDLFLDEEALERYADDYINRLQELECLVDAGDITPNAAYEGCFSTCDECVEAFMNGHSTEAAAINAYVTEQLNNWDTTGLTPDEIDLLEERFTREWLLFVEACRAPCTPDGVIIDGETSGEGGQLNSISCENAASSMIDDMKPNGQYGASYTLINEEGFPETIDNEDVVNIYSPDNMLSQLYVGDAGSSFDYRNPYHWEYDASEPLGQGKYYDAVGNESFISVFVDDEGNYDPPLDVPAGVVLDPDSENPGFVLASPQLLANTEDFTQTYWQNSWAESLLVYHPEYCYLEYLRELCNLTVSGINIDIDGDGASETVSWNSDGYDNFLSSLNYQDAMTFLGPNEAALMDNDPYFSGTIPNVDGEDLTNRQSIMEEALTEAFQGSDQGITIAKFAYMAVACNSLGNCVVPDYSDIILNVNVLETDEQELFWQMYLANYLSLKQTINYVYMSRHAILNGCYNGCIGDSDPQDDLEQLLRDYSNTDDLNEAHPNGSYCREEATEELFLLKQKRFTPVDNLYDSEDNDEQILADIEAQTDYGYYAQTGQCPLARDLQLYLDGLVHMTDDNTDPVDITGNMGVYQELFLSRELFDDLGYAGEPYPYPGDLIISGSISGQQLAIETSEPSTTPVNLNLPASLSWNDYGTLWLIEEFSSVHYTTYFESISLFAFETIAQVITIGEDGFDEVILTGTTVARIGECTGSSTADENGDGDVTNDSPGEVLDDTGYNCDRKDRFEIAVKNLMEALADEGDLNNTSGVNIDNLPAYSEGYLPEFFGVENTTGATWTFTTASGSLSVYTLAHNGNTLFSLQIQVSGTFSMGADDEFNYININGVPAATDSYAVNLQIENILTGATATVETVTLFGGSIEFSCCTPITQEEDEEDCTGPDSDGGNILQVDGTFENMADCFSFDVARNTYSFSGPSPYCPDALNYTGIIESGRFTMELGSSSYFTIGRQFYEEVGIERVRGIDSSDNGSFYCSGTAATYDDYPYYNDFFNCPVFAYAAPNGGRYFYTAYVNGGYTEAQRPTIAVQVENLIIGHEYTVKYLQTAIDGRSRGTLETSAHTEIHFGNQVQQGGEIQLTFQPGIYIENNIWIPVERTFVAQNTSEVLQIKSYNTQGGVYIGLDNIEVIGGDGIPDACDSCPLVTNTGGDSDNDGIDNACDTCPNIPNPTNDPSFCDATCTVGFTAFQEDFEFYDQTDSSECTSDPLSSYVVPGDTPFILRPAAFGGTSYVVLNKENYDTYGCDNLTQNDGSNLWHTPEPVGQPNLESQFSAIFETYIIENVGVDALTGLKVTLDCLEIGKEYRVSYDYSSIKQPGRTSPNAATQVIITFGDQVYEGVIVGYTDEFGTNTWATESVTFIAQHTSEEVRFLGTFIVDPELPTGTHARGYHAYDNIRIEAVDFINPNRALDDETAAIGDIESDPSCTYCIPQEVAPVSCTEMFPVFQDIITQVNGDVDGNGTVDEGEFGIYTLSAWFDETYFCNMNFAYITTAYGQYLQTFQITHTGHSQFLTIAEFGATPLNYGFNDMHLVIEAYANYIDGLDQDEVPITWPGFAEDYLEANPGSCPPRPLHPVITAPVEDGMPPCEQFEINVYEAYNQDAYDAYIEQLKQEFRVAYLQAGLTQLDENLDLTYADKEYQYTLYYYDQAGNLAQTVPPEGVTRLDGNDQTLNQAIDNYRITAASDTQDNETLIPDHDLQTQYKYNSLNQLVWQRTPDGGITRFAYDDLGRIIASQNAKQRIANFVDFDFIEETPGSFDFYRDGDYIKITRLGNNWARGYGSTYLQNNGYVSYKLTEPDTKNNQTSIALSYEDSPPPLWAPDYFITTHLISGQLKAKLYEKSTHVGTVDVEINDELRLERINGVVNYSRNGEVELSIPESQPDAPIRLDFSVRYATHHIDHLQYVDLGDNTIDDIKRFSYTTYDGLGRITEAGEISPLEDLYRITEEGRLEQEIETIIEDSGTGETVVLVDYEPVNGFDFEQTVRREITQTIYDDVVSLTPFSTTDPYDDSGDLFENFNPFTLRNRVAGVMYYDRLPTFENPGAGPQFDNAIFYNYDIHGNVRELVNFYCDLYKKYSDRYLRRVSYDYDLISGNVKQVTFQKGKNDQFIHKYDYDADNRITAVHTSHDGHIWEQDATYNYYAHGPLARMKMGDKQVQGSDYVYTLQGWLKSVNGEYIDDPSGDFGKDGMSSSLIARDAFGYSLNYYAGDYQPVVAGVDAEPLALSQNTNIPQSTNDLYNGNIKQMTTSLRQKENQMLHTQVNRYTYDQLNRIKTMNSSAVEGLADNVYNSYASSYSYDRNGNLQNLVREVFDWDNPATGILTSMDNLSYAYREGTNRLTRVSDAVVNDPFTADIEDQLPQIQYDPNNIQTHNYVYDEIGQLIEDKSEHLRIEWRVDGKVDKVRKYYDDTFVKNIETTVFEYDGLGNRIAKRFIDNNNEKVTTTYYARDAQGNVLGVMQADADADAINNNTFSSFGTKEHHIYGSSRLGIEEREINNERSVTDTTLDDENTLALEISQYAYGNWNISGIEEPYFTDSNYKVESRIVLTQPLVLNDSLKVATLAYVNNTREHQTSGPDIVTYRDNYLEVYIKNVDGEYKPSFYSYSLMQGQPLSRLDVVSQKGVTEQVILSDGLPFNFTTLFDQPQGIYKATLDFDDQEVYEIGNGLTFTQYTGAVQDSIQTDRRSQLGGDTTGRYQINKLYYRLTTGFNTIEDQFIFDDQVGSTQLQGDNITMTMVASEDFWQPSRFNNSIRKRTFTKDVGDRRYELSNHLGNVLSVVSDKKIPTLSGDVLTHFNADVLAYNDYYPFGMLQPGRHQNTSDYRYGFNGMELDNEVKGEGLSLGTYWRQYEPRVGRWLTTDPVVEPSESPYAFSRNNPIKYNDPQGDCPDCEDVGVARTAERIVNEHFDPDENLKDISEKLIEAIKESSVIDGKFDKERYSELYEKVNHVWLERQVLDGLRPIYDKEFQSLLSAEGISREEYLLIQDARSYFVADLIVKMDLIDQANMALTYAGIFYGAANIRGLFSNMPTPRGYVGVIRPSYQMNSKKFDYFFGKVTVSSNATPKQQHNATRSAQNKKDLATLGVKDNAAGRAYLRVIFDRAITQGTLIRTSETTHGLNKVYKIQIGNKGALEVGFFYPKGNTNLTPRVTTIIPKL